MEEKEFANVVLDCDILTKKELSDMMKYFNSVLKFPVGFSAAKRSGSGHRVSRFGLGKKWQGWRYPWNCSDSITVSVDKTINLHAVRLFGSENNEYSVILKVYCNGVTIVTKTDKFLSKLFQSEGGDYHGFDIMFEPPITLEAQNTYLIQAFISGPPSWCGKNGLSCVEHAGVTFFFLYAESWSRANYPKKRTIFGD